MKLFKYAPILLIFFQFVSCIDQEDTVVFYLDNKLESNLEVSVNSIENINANVVGNSAIDIRETGSYGKYIRRLRDLEITNFQFHIVGNDENVTQAKLIVEDLEISDFSLGINGTYQLDNQATLDVLAQKFMDKKVLVFRFEGESSSDENFSIHLEIDMLGTFKH